MYVVIRGAVVRQTTYTLESYFNVLLLKRESRDLYDGLSNNLAGRSSDGNAYLWELIPFISPWDVPSLLLLLAPLRVMSRY